MRTNKTYVYLEGRVKQTTHKAVLFEFKNNGSFDSKWFPRSICEEGNDVNINDETLNVEEWFCVKENIDQ